MNVDLGIWAKLTKIVVFLLFLAALLGVAVWYMPLIQKNERMRKRMMTLDQQIQQAEETSRQLKTSIEALRSDPKAVERLARARLGVARAGETVIRFEEAATNSPPH
jgi:cell division protein FtsB